MNQRWKCWAAAALGLMTLLAGCLPWNPDSSGGSGGMPGKTVGVFNAFPEHPVYLKEKTLVVSHSRREIEQLSLKPGLTSAMVRFLEAKGYRAVAVDDPSALTRGEVDMLIRILPLQVQKAQGMTAYGFSDREFLWGLLRRPASSFVALQLSLQRAHSPRVVKTDREERFSRLEDREMPETWESLSPAEQKIFEDNLRANLLKAAYLSLARLKI